jgi:hypothetical protein
MIATEHRMDLLQGQTADSSQQLRFYTASGTLCVMPLGAGHRVAGSARSTLSLDLLYAVRLKQTSTDTIRCMRRIAFRKPLAASNGASLSSIARMIRSISSWCVPGVQAPPDESVRHDDR